MVERMLCKHEVIGSSPFTSNLANTCLTNLTSTKWDVLKTASCRRGYGIQSAIENLKLLRIHKIFIQIFKNTC